MLPVEGDAGLVEANMPLLAHADDMKVDPADFSIFCSYASRISVRIHRRYSDRAEGRMTTALPASEPCIVQSPGFASSSETKRVLVDQAPHGTFASLNLLRRRPKSSWIMKKQ